MGKKAFSKIFEVEEDGGRIKEKKRAFSLVETEENLQIISEKLSDKGKNLASNFVVPIAGNENSQSMQECLDNMQGSELQFLQGLAKSGHFPIPSNVVSRALNVMGSPGKSPEKSKKVNINAANFVFTNGTLTATDGENYELVGNFALKILEEKKMVEEIVNEANEKIGTKVEHGWKILINVADKTEYEENIKGGEILELGWLERVTGNRAVLNNEINAKKLFKRYVQNLILAENYPILTEYASSGWKWLPTGQVCYLTSQGAVGMEHLPIRAASGFHLLTRPANEQQIFQEFMGMRSIIPGNPENAVFLQYYVMAALLTALFKKAGYQIEFSTALIGKTNTKKTTCGEIFSRVFNRTPSAVPEINFSATEAAIYEIMDRYADTVVMIDDLTPAENDLDAREKNRKLESIIRAYGDRVPRRRSVAFASNSTAKEFTPINGCALITGETFSGGKSSRSRVIILNFEEGDVSDSALSYYQENLYILPNFVDSLLRFVTEHVEQIMRQISQDCAKIRAEMKGKIRLPRYIDAFAVLYSVTNIFGAYTAEKGLLSQEEISNLIENDREALLRIVQENDAAVSNVSPGIMLLESLKFTVNREGICVKNVAEIGEGKVTDYLIYDENFIYITSEKLWECGRRYADYRRQYFPYKNGRELLTPLKEEGLIFLKREGRSLRATHKITVNGTVINQRFLYLYRRLSEEKLSAAEDY